MRFHKHRLNEHHKIALEAQLSSVHRNTVVYEHASLGYTESGKIQIIDHGERYRPRSASLGHRAFIFGIEGIEGDPHKNTETTTFQMLIESRLGSCFIPKQCRGARWPYPLKQLQPLATNNDEHPNDCGLALRRPETTSGTTPIAWRLTSLLKGSRAARWPYPLKQPQPMAAHTTRLVHKTVAEHLAQASQRRQTREADHKTATNLPHQVFAFWQAAAAIDQITADRRGSQGGD